MEGSEDFYWRSGHMWDDNCLPLEIWSSTVMWCTIFPCLHCVCQHQTCIWSRFCFCCTLFLVNSAFLLCSIVFCLRLFFGFVVLIFQFSVTLSEFLHGAVILTYLWHLRTWWQPCRKNEWGAFERFRRRKEDLDDLAHPASLLPVPQRWLGTWSWTRSWSKLVGVRKIIGGKWNMSLTLATNYSNVYNFT